MQSCGEALSRRHADKQQRHGLPDQVVQHLAEVIDQCATRKARHSLKYMGELLSMKCAPDLLMLNLYPNFKELTESAASYNAARQHLSSRFPLNDPEVTAVFPGDGCTPRTAAMFAFRSAWRCISVDPALRLSASYDSVKRLELRQCRIQDTVIEAKKLVIVAVHSHATLAETLGAIRMTAPGNVGIVAMGCCVPLVLDREPDAQWRDPGVLSPQNLIKVWRHL